MITSPSFLKFLRSAPGVLDEEVEFMLSCFRTMHLPAKSFLIREGEICKQISYVDKGCISYYQLLESGKKSIIYFAFEDWWTGDLNSFLNRVPATTFWQALEDTDLIFVNRNDFDLLTKESPGFKYLFNLKTQAGYIHSLNKAARDKSESAEEKYLRMLNDYPQIIQRVPHYDIAAYLGIAPESLSRIRNKLSQK